MLSLYFETVMSSDSEELWLTFRVKVVDGFDVTDEHDTSQMRTVEE